MVVDFLWYIEWVEERNYVFKWGIENGSKIEIPGVNWYQSEYMLKIVQFFYVEGRNMWLATLCQFPEYWWVNRVKGAKRGGRWSAGELGCRGCGSDSGLPFRTTSGFTLHLSHLTISPAAQQGCACCQVGLKTHCGIVCFVVYFPALPADRLLLKLIGRENLEKISIFLQSYNNLP